jgi:hypothetical protein
VIAAPQLPQSVLDQNDEFSPDDMRLRTVKKGRGGPVFSIIDQGPSGMKAVQAAIG